MIRILPLIPLLSPAQEVRLSCAEKFVSIRAWPQVTITGF